MTDKIFTKHLRELTDEAIRESLAEISVEFEKRFGPAALTASPPVVEREAGDLEQLAVDLHNSATFRAQQVISQTADALPQAITKDPKLVNSIVNLLEALTVRIAEILPDQRLLDAILALTPVEGVGGRLYPRQIAAINETAEFLDACAGEELEVDGRSALALVEELQDAFFSEDQRDCFHLEVKRALAALSTPVAQGDEVRDALLSTMASLAAAISLLEKGGKSAKKAAPSDTMFDQMLVDYRAALTKARATLTKGARDAG